MATKYKDYSLGYKLRTIITQLILPYTSDHKIIQPIDLHSILINVFKYKQYQVTYQKMKILSYANNKYVNITIQQYIDYVIEKHLGENAVNLYKYNVGYKKMDENLMDRQEFKETLVEGLKFIFQDKDRLNQENFKQQFDILYDQILAKTSVNSNISFEIYKQFLKEYMGSKSPMSINPTKTIKNLSLSQQFIQSQHKINYKQFINQFKIQDKHNKQHQNNKFQQTSIHNSPQKKVQPSQNQYSYSYHTYNRPSLLSKDINAQSYVNLHIDSKYQSSLYQFQSLIHRQIRIKSISYDKDGDGYFYRQQFQTFLYDILELEYNSITFISNNYFNQQSSNRIQIQQFIELICQIHFREIFTNLIKMELKQTLSQRCLMSLGFFRERIMENCFFFQNKPSIKLLERVYEELLQTSSNNTRNQISLQDFNTFIYKYCCSNKQRLRNISKKNHNNLKNHPISIQQVQNSNYEQDQSQRNLNVIQSNLSKDQINSRRSRNNMSMRQIQESRNRHDEGAQTYNIYYGNNSEQKVEDEVQTEKNKDKITISEKQLFLENYKPIITQKQIHQNQQERRISHEKQSNFTKIQMQSVQYSYKIQPLSSLHHQFSLKKQLWTNLKSIFLKYSLKNYQQQTLTLQQFQKLISNQYIFTNRQTYIKNVQKLYSKQKSKPNNQSLSHNSSESSLQIQCLIRYYIHQIGEQSLLSFNKKQIKGKSLLNTKQISQIIEAAYDNILKRSKDDYFYFVQGQVARVKNRNNENYDSKKEIVWSYKEYLEYISRDLSKKNDL